MIAVSVCIGSSCHLRGSYPLVEALSKLVEEYHVKDKVELKASFCMGHCLKPVCVRIEGEDEVYSVNEDTAKEFFEAEILPRMGE